MKLNTRIVVPPRYSLEHECDVCLKTINDMLYNVTINQEIKIINDNGKHIRTKVIGVYDSVYDNSIYRYIEVVVIDTHV